MRSICKTGLQILYNYNLTLTLPFEHDEHVPHVSGVVHGEPDGQDDADGGDNLNIQPPEVHGPVDV